MTRCLLYQIFLAFVGVMIRFPMTDLLKASIQELIKTKESGFWENCKIIRVWTNCEILVACQEKVLTICIALKSILLMSIRNKSKLHSLFQTYLENGISNKPLFHSTKPKYSEHTTTRHCIIFAKVFISCNWMLFLIYCWIVERASNTFGIS